MTLFSFFCTCFSFAAQSWGVLVYENLHALNILTKGSLLDTLSDRECRLVLALMVRESYKVCAKFYVFGVCLYLKSVPVVGLHGLLYLILLLRICIILFLLLSNRSLHHTGA